MQFKSKQNSVTLKGPSGKIYCFLSNRFTRVVDPEDIAAFTDSPQLICPPSLSAQVKKVVYAEAGKPPVVEDLTPAAPKPEKPKAKPVEPVVEEDEDKGADEDEDEADSEEEEEEEEEEAPPPTKRKKKKNGVVRSRRGRRGS